ncbi:hypothetical protein [uncultured Polaribacter sp.]|uniref:hypothetical protein n=1 Tax=uncultured Polaribacter sp. TaxID=174711 RepID=UPI00261EF8F3|nr:hypothetical protein [uncultured Polaribacter sp.]
MMFLQILPPETVATSSIFDTHLLFIILGLAIGVFAIIKTAKLLSKIKVSKTAEKPSYTS